MTINPSQIDQLIEVRRGDTQRVLYDQLLLNSEPINLSGSSVTLVILDTKTNDVTRRVATITSAISGSVQYQFVAEDLATTGSRLMEWEIVDSGGLELTIPTTKYVKMNILPDLR